MVKSLRYRNIEDTEAFTVRLDRDIYNQLKAVSHATNASMNYLVSNAIEQYLSSTPEGQVIVSSANALTSNTMAFAGATANDTALGALQEVVNKIGQGTEPKEESTDAEQ